MSMNTKGRKIRVFLVDDHPIIRRGLSLLLHLEPDMLVCGEADNSNLALEKILSLKPDVAIVDLQLKGASGLELIKQLRSQGLSLKILVCTMQSILLFVERALRAGADGYITKEQGSDVVVEAIRVIMAGRRYLSRDVAKRYCDAVGSNNRPKDRSPQTLTDRQIEVLQLLGRGFSSREISESLHVSIKTVETHRENIKTKLGLSGAMELMQFALSWVSALQTPAANRSAAQQGAGQCLETHKTRDFFRAPFGRQTPGHGWNGASLP